MIDFSELQQEIHQNAINKGFWDKPISFELRLALAISELYEALEAHRSGRFANLPSVEEIESMSDYDFTIWFKQEVKDTFEDELADVIIRLLDMGAEKGWIASNIIPYFVSPNGEIGSEIIQVTRKIYEILDLQSFYKAIETVFILAKSPIIVRHMKLKMKFNKTRERLHGKNY